MAEAQLVRALTPGVARGPVLVLDEPLSFWGGLDPATGHVIDAHHPQAGATLAGGRARDAVGTRVELELLRASPRRSAPAPRRPRSCSARPTPIVALGAIVAAELYGIEVPVVVAPGAGLTTGDVVTVRADDDGGAHRLV